MVETAPDRPWVGSACHAMLAAVFLAWWLPQDMGVRPEGVVCACAAAAMYAVLVAWRRERLAVAWLAFALAGLWLRRTPHRVHAARATAGRAAPAAAAGRGPPAPRWPRRCGPSRWPPAAWSRRCSRSPTAGWRDFLRGQQIFLSIQAQESWATEIQRYSFLLSQIPMGNYAKRAAVLLCLVSLAWFAVLGRAARMRRVQLPVTLWLSGSTTALAFAALWLTPSKWTHHFGALAGVGSAFLALFLVLAVPTVRSVLGMWLPPFGPRPGWSGRTCWPSR